MRYKIIIITLVAALAASCNQQSKVETTADSTVVDHHNHKDATEAIELNNGEKWKVNDEMMPPILAMEKDINAFATADQKDYKSLAKKLQLNIDLLTSNCTMKGKAHDELHKWLLPYIDLVDELAKAKTNEESSEIFAEIQISYKTFNQYFQ